MKHISSIALFGVVSLHSPLSASAEAPKHHRAVQPPGLYQVDWEGRADIINEKGAPLVIEGKIDGASGDASNRLRSGVAARDFAEKGKQLHTQCLQAGTPAAQAAGKASCPDHTVKTVDLNTLSYVSNCPTIQMTRTVKRIDDKTWAIDTTMKFKGNMPTQFASPAVRERWTRVSDVCK